MTAAWSFMSVLCLKMQIIKSTPEYPWEFFFPEDPRPLMMMVRNLKIPGRPIRDRDLGPLTNEEDKSQDGIWLLEGLKWSLHWLTTYEMSLYR